MARTHCTRSCRGNFNYFSSHQSQSAIGKSGNRLQLDIRKIDVQREELRVLRVLHVLHLLSFVVNWIYSFSWPCPLPHSPLVCPLMIALRLWQLHFRFLIAFGTSWLDDNRQGVAQRLPPCSATKDTRNYWNCFAISLDSPPSPMGPPFVLECPLCRCYRCTRLWLSHWNFLILSDSKYLWILVIDFQTARQVPMSFGRTPPSLSLLLRHLLACKYLLVSLSVRIRVVFELLISC